MTTVYLHVGLPKTGTTYLQRSYFPNLAGLQFVGKPFRAPPTGLLERLFDATEKYPHFVDMNERRVEVERLLDGIPEDKLLISDERLIGDVFWGFRDHAHTTEVLSELFPDARVILTIRRQDDLLESLYRECLRKYYSLDVDVFLNYDGRAFVDRFRPAAAFLSVNVRRYDYDVYARSYAATFGRENVLVLPLELLEADPVRYHATVAGFLGCDPFQPPNVAAVNQSYSSLSCRIALLLNRFVRVPRWERRALRFIPHEPLTGLLSRRTERDRFYRLLDSVNRRLSLRYFLENVVDRLPGPAANQIDHEKRRMIMEIHNESNRRLDEEHGLGLKEYGYY